LSSSPPGGAPTSGAPRGGALVTGAARRIGRSLALAAAKAGFDLAIHVREDDKDARSLQAEVTALGRKAAILTGDLTDDDVLSGLVARAAAAVGPLALLVNNAALFEDDRLPSLTAASLDAHLSANLRAPVLLTRAFAAQAPAGAQVVNMLDQRVLKPTPQYFSYALAKAALWEATRMSAQALAPRIRVNGIGPGPTLPNHSQSETDFAAEAAATPLERRATPDDIAAALTYLIDAIAVTGQMIAVDGGQHLAWRTPDILHP
jgi:NAD(P)-dependent dehydrogenase (short-subunit alcohol dehydrogenase family)